MKSEVEECSQTSRLCTEQVITFGFWLFAVFILRFGMAGYQFADENFERYSSAIIYLLPVVMAIVVGLGPKSRVRTIALFALTPVAILFSMGSCLVATDFNEFPEYNMSEIHVGPVVYKILSNYDITYRPISSSYLTLRMERLVFNGFLKERWPLLELVPADEASIEIVNGGNSIEFSSPAFMGRKPVVRTFSTDWNTARKIKFEIVRLTKDELGAAAAAKIRAYNNQ